MSLFSWLKPKVSRLLALLRDGGIAFAAANIDKGLAIALDMLKTAPYASSKEFTDMLWARLRMEFPNSPGGWIDLLKAFIFEALKKQGKI